MLDLQVAVYSNKMGHAPKWSNWAQNLQRRSMRITAQCTDRIYEDLEKIKKEACRMTAESLSYWLHGVYSLQETNQRRRGRYKKVKVSQMQVHAMAYHISRQDWKKRPGAGRLMSKIQKRSYDTMCDMQNNSGDV